MWVAFDSRQRRVEESVGTLGNVERILGNHFCKTGSPNPSKKTFKIRENTSHVKKFLKEESEEETIFKMFPPHEGGRGRPPSEGGKRKDERRKILPRVRRENKSTVHSKKRAKCDPYASVRMWGKVPDREQGRDEDGQWKKERGE